MVERPYCKRNNHSILIFCCCNILTQVQRCVFDTIDTWLITDIYQLPISWYTISGWGLCKGSCIIHVTWLNFTLRRLHAPTFLGIKFRLHHSPVTREESLTIISFATLKLVVKTYCNWIIETWCYAKLCSSVKHI